MSADARPSDGNGRHIIDLLPRLYRHAGLLCRSSDQAIELVVRSLREAPSLGSATVPALLSSVHAAWRRTPEGTMIDTVPMSGPADPLFETIRYLPEDQREVLLLVCAEQFGYRQTADMLRQEMAELTDGLLQARRRIGKSAGIDGADARHDDDVTFMAFADGELKERARQAVERAMDANPEFVERTGFFIRTAALARETLDAQLQDPIPPALHATVQTLIEQTSTRKTGPLAAIKALFSGRDYQ